ncbi:hypothetical protein RB653_005540 [Dictyostelium firmibasis]|uniref:Uncharacterized protein n=1 Tax=Dictyostelium firmibasis TaxID=79012 RepID=A0AAN7UCT8_9MYCE
MYNIGNSYNNNSNNSNSNNNTNNNNGNSRKRSSPPLFINNNSNNYISPPSPLSPKQTNNFLFNNGGFNSFQNPQQSSQQPQQQLLFTSPIPTRPQNLYQYIDENELNTGYTTNNIGNHNMITTTTTTTSSPNTDNKKKVKKQINFKLDNLHDDSEQEDSDDDIDDDDDDDNDDENGKQDEDKDIEEDKEYHETNTDFGLLSVASKEDLMVCLSVLKKEMGQFKNLSHNLLSRLQILENGIGQEKMIRLLNNNNSNNNYMNGSSDSSNSSGSSGHSRNNSDHDNMIDGYYSTIIRNGNNSLLTQQQQYNQDVAMISTFLVEVQKIVEKQRQYDSLLAQREKYWDIELNKITMAVLNKLGQNSSSPISTNDLPNSPYFVNNNINSNNNNNNANNSNSNNNNNNDFSNFNDDGFYNSNNSCNSEDFDSFTALNNINNSIIRNQSSNSLNLKDNPEETNFNSLKSKTNNIFKRFYIGLFGTKKTITFWKKVAIIAIIVIVWPLIANFTYKFIVYLINKRRLSKLTKVQPLVGNSSSTATTIGKSLRPIKSSSPSSSSNLLLPSSINSGNALKKIKSSLMKKNSDGGIGNTVSSVASNIGSSGSEIGAPDIVKAFIQGVSTGDGGSNDNLTNNTLSTITNTLGNLNTVANSSIAPSIGSSLIGSSSSISPSSLSSSSAASNLISNFTPSALSQLNLPGSSSTTSSSSSNPVSFIANNFISDSSRSRSPSSTSNTNSSDSENGMLKLVRNLLSHR